MKGDGIKNQVEIAIIGGGLIGMLTAHALVKAGAKVVVFEKSTAAMESSWAGGGILTPLYPWRYPNAVNELAFQSQLSYPALAEEIHMLSGLDPEFQRCGMSILASDVDSTAHAWLTEHKIVNHVVHPAFQAARQTTHQAADQPTDQPRLAASLTEEYVHLPEIAQIRNPRFIKSLKLALEKLGVIFSVNNTVQRFKVNKNGGFCVETAQGQWRADKVIVCAGAWTAQLLLPLMTEQQARQFTVDIAPVRGQILLYKTEPKTISSIILAKGKYVIPRIDGRVLVGSTMENVGFNKSTTESGLIKLKQFVADICPVLQNFPIEKHWAGLRPSSPNGIPYIGEHPEIKGLFVNSGHFRNGVVMAPASAALMCDLVNGNKPQINPLGYSISR